MNGIKTLVKCQECGKKTYNETHCQDCCEHLDVCRDERICLDCDKDMTESMASAAYDRFKDQRKYGGL